MTAGADRMQTWKSPPSVALASCCHLVALVCPVTALIQVTWAHFPVPSAPPVNLKSSWPLLPPLPLSSPSPLLPLLHVLKNHKASLLGPSIFPPQTPCIRFIKQPSWLVGAKQGAGQKLNFLEAHCRLVKKRTNSDPYWIFYLFLHFLVSFLSLFSLLILSLFCHSFSKWICMLVLYAYLGVYEMHL